MLFYVINFIEQNNYINKGPNIITYNHYMLLGFNYIPRTLTIIDC